MATYAIGDIQGCFASLNRLLEKIQFNPTSDTLWLVGDLINRGPRSLEVLRFLASLPQKIVILGNHDIHFLGVYFGVRAPHPKDTLAQLLAAPDVDQLVKFLLQQKLFHWDRHQGYAITHAGIHPSWTFEEAEQYSLELEHEFQNSNSTQLKNFLAHLFGDEPRQWSSSLQGADRTRCLINCFTRMRVCDPDLSLRLDYKGTYERRPEHTEAWFNLRTWNDSEKLIFGHWAALMGDTKRSNLFGIDTGCVWGQHLTALRLEDAFTFAVKRDKDDSENLQCRIGDNQISSGSFDSY
jgi:bis(5'-nucleosyl)-tetraphosphatase (symmetrical)